MVSSQCCREDESPDKRKRRFVCSLLLLLPLLISVIEAQAAWVVVDPCCATPEPRLLKLTKMWVSSPTCTQLGHPLILSAGSLGYNGPEPSDDIFTHRTVTQAVLWLGHCSPASGTSRPLGSKSRDCGNNAGIYPWRPNDISCQTCIFIDGTTALQLHHGRPKLVIYGLRRLFCLISSDADIHSPHSVHVKMQPQDSTGRIHKETFIVRMVIFNHIVLG